MYCALTADSSFSEPPGKGEQSGVRVLFAIAVFIHAYNEIVSTAGNKVKIKSPFGCLSVSPAYHSLLTVNLYLGGLEASYWPFY